METLIIQVDCKPQNQDAPPQLGITVEAPHSVAQQQRQQQALKDYRNHDYQNCQIPCDIKPKNNNEINNVNPSNGMPSSTLSSRNITGNLSEQIQRGLQITQIQQGSVIDRNGQFRIGDIIVEVNGINLQRRSFQEAQKTLREFVVKQSSHAPLLLRILRKAASSSSLPSTTGSQATVIEREECAPDSSEIPTSNKLCVNSTSTPSPQSFNGARHFAGALNTRKIGNKHRIKLKKSQDGGFGIKIAERDNMFGLNRPIYITAITTTGAAFRDGRLKEGDMLLEVNGIDLSSKSQPEVAQMLKAVGVGEVVEFVVSRQETFYANDYRFNHRNHASSIAAKSSDNTCDSAKSLIDLDVADQDDLVFNETTSQQFEQKIDNILNVPTKDGPGTYIYDIPLNDTKSAGLGLYLKYPTLDRKDLGIWIEKVITGGAAWKDGRLQPDDQILAINGISLTSLSNAEASETLTAAVCRGIGLDVGANTIRLNIHRRDPSVVARILHGTNNRIEHSDKPSTGHDRTSPMTEKLMNSTRESYQTALDNTLHSGPQSSNETSSSTRSSNQNSQNDSAMSPQTQASNSVKLSSSGNDRLDQNCSDKTNDTSSSISQITDFTTLPIVENTASERDSSNDDNQAAFTLPKAIEMNDSSQNVDPASSIQSWDDESIDTSTGGADRFQRDGFGRQSISEKRHAQLMAKNTDTFKRNQKLREERDRQRQISEIREKRLLEENKRRSLNLSVSNHSQKMANSITVSNMNSIYGRHARILADGNHIERTSADSSFHREVPVDVQPNMETRSSIRKRADIVENGIQFRSDSTRIALSSQHIPDLKRGHTLGSQVSQVNRSGCVRSGCASHCACRMGGADRSLHVHDLNLNNYSQSLKKSNSLESIQHDIGHKDLMTPRAGTVRVARNRKINESFRAAVDRSYEGSMNDSSRCAYSDVNRLQSDVSVKIGSSLANSTTSTSNDERYLIGNNVDSNNNQSHKKSSLLTRFLKFGSMKKDKRKGKDATTNKSSDKVSNELTVSESETVKHKSSSKSAHSRAQSSQSHSDANLKHRQQNVVPPANGRLYDGSIAPPKQVLHQHQSRTDSINPNQHRASMHMYQYHPVPDSQSHNSMQYQPMVHHKFTDNPASRQTNHHQYSHLPVHNHIPPVPIASYSQNQQQHLSTMGLLNHGPQFQNMAIQNSHLAHPNGCQSASQWHSPVHAPNGLWVANSPVSEGMQMLNHTNYTGYGQHINHLHNLQTPINLPHPTAFIPQANNSNRMFHQPSRHVAPIPHQHLHHQQPQQIYYYDF